MGIAQSVDLCLAEVSPQWRLSEDGSIFLVYFSPKHAVVRREWQDHLDPHRRHVYYELAQAEFIAKPSFVFCTGDRIITTYDSSLVTVCWQRHEEGILYFEVLSVIPASNEDAFFSQGEQVIKKWYRFNASSDLMEEIGPFENLKEELTSNGIHSIELKTPAALVGALVNGRFRKMASTFYKP
jgi:hypothetical protein